MNINDNNKHAKPAYFFDIVSTNEYRRQAGLFDLNGRLNANDAAKRKAKIDASDARESVKTFKKNNQ